MDNQRDVRIYSSKLQGELKYQERKHFNDFMKPLDKYLKRLGNNLDENAENYREHSKECFINAMQALYDEKGRDCTTTFNNR